MYRHCNILICLADLSSIHHLFIRWNLWNSRGRRFASQEKVPRARMGHEEPQELAYTHRPTGDWSTVAVFRRSPQACIMQLGLLTEHPDPCSSTALELVRDGSRTFLWPTTFRSDKAQAHLRLSSIIGIPVVFVTCMTRNGDALPTPVIRVTAQARQAMSSQKLNGHLFENQKAISSSYTMRGLIRRFYSRRLDLHPVISLSLRRVR